MLLSDTLLNVVTSPTQLALLAFALLLIVSNPACAMIVPLQANERLQTPLLLLTYNLTLHPLHPYPGPLLFRASRLPWVLSLQRGNFHNLLLSLHEKYGPVVRIAPDELSYTHPSAWKEIYLNPRIKRADVWFKKDTIQKGEPHSIMGANEEVHGRVKRGLAGAFGERAVRGHSGLMEGYVGALIERLRGLCDNDEGGGEASVDIVSWLNMVTFDVSGDLSFGSSFGSIENGSPHPWVEISNAFGKGVALMASLNFYPAWVKRALLRVMPRKTMEKMRYHKALTHERLEERVKYDGERADFVQSLLDYNQESSVQEKGRGISMEELEVNMPVILFAGSETTSTAIASTLWYLLRSERWLREVKEEVRHAFQQEEDIRMVTTAKMEVLVACLSEGLRLGPPSAITPPRIVGKGGETICGRFVPEGTLLGVNQYPAFRSSSNFSEPDVFNPARFLAQTGETPSAFHPFLLGRHSCIGEKFAWAQMRVILARLLFTFDISLDESQPSTIQDWGEQKTFIFWQKEKLNVKLKPA